MAQKKEVSMHAYFSTIPGYATGYFNCYVPTNKSKQAISLEEIKKIVGRKVKKNENRRVRS